MIHRVRIQNFKSILDVTVDLSPVTVLVGRSGTGKSNFVEALRFLRDVLSAGRPAEALEVRWDRLRPAMTTNSNDHTSFEVCFSIAGVGDRFTYELTVSKEGPRKPPFAERLKHGKECLFHQHSAAENSKAQWVVEPALVPPPPPGEIALGRIPAISNVVVAYTALTTGIGCYAFPDTVLADEVGGQWMTGLSDDATNFLYVLKDILSNLQDLTRRKSTVEALQRVNPAVSSVELDNILQPTRVVVGHRFDGKTLTLRLSQESSGFRRFYAYLLALYQQPPKQILIFEHPEDGIHPGALSLLADEFKAAPGAGRGQVILTTHSPKLLDHFEPDQIRVVELDGLQTRIGPVSTEQREAIAEQLLDAGELLTVDPARKEPQASEATGA